MPSHGRSGARPTFASLYWYSMPYNFRDRVIPVTGGGGDIGGAICQELDSHGALVVVLDNDAAGGQARLERLSIPRRGFCSSMCRIPRR